MATDVQEPAEQEQVFDDIYYSYLAAYATKMEKPARPVLGRDKEIRRLLASLNRPELSNAFLLGEAGSGKTMLVQGASERDPKRLYVEVDLSKMAASEDGEDGVVQMAPRLKGLVDDALRYKDDNDHASELVLFIDEFHLLVQLSTAAAQAIKPILAESGRRGIKIIAATTFSEFHDYVEQDQALMQRLQRINIREPEKETVVSILKSIARSHGVAGNIHDDTLYQSIYDYSNRYVPADSQPRKSILMLDSMIGWYQTFPGEFKMDHHLLADVIEDSTGIKVTFEVDGRWIQHALNQRVFAQKAATKALEQRLQIAVADLHDKSRPISSFLFSGPTGVGKTELVKGMGDLLLGDERAMIRFDMSEYALDDSLNRFREELTTSVWNRSHSVVLFDEVEKASPVITRLMLQVLDDGRLSNAQGREVSFLNTYIVLTTNAGSEVYENIAHYAQDDEGESGLDEYQKVIRRSLINNEAFPTELINRMNAIIPFQPLSHRTYERIIMNKIRAFQNNVKHLHNVNVKIHPDVIGYLVYENFDVSTDSGGARGLVARMDQEVVSPVARYINSNPAVRDIGVYIEGRMAYRHKEIRESEASVTVGTIDRKRLRREKESSKVS